MQTAVVRITAPPQKGGAYPVELLVVETDGLATPKLVARASAEIPPELTPGVLVEERAGAGPLTAARVIALYGGSDEILDSFSAVGTFLFRLVFRDKVADVWSQLRDESQGGLRTILDIERSLRPLHALPWELMYDPESGTHLFLDLPRPFVRGEPRTVGEVNPLVHLNARTYSFPTDDWPLRVLVVFGADPDFAAGKLRPGVGASGELRELEALFGASRFDVDYEVLEHPSRKEIIAACASVQPHVLHFIGHGEGDVGSNKHALLIHHAKTSTEEAYYEKWSLDDIRNDLQGLPLRFAFLNACRTSGAAAATTAAPGVPFGNIADAFLNLGTLGVVGMQGDVPGDVAVDFSRTFYEAVIEGCEVDVAVTRARRALSQAPTRPDFIRRRAWSYPVLRTRVLPSLVLPRRPNMAGKGTLVQRFVSRVPQRRMVRQAVSALVMNPHAGASPYLVAIVGDPKVGKSHLAMWCTQACERHGQRGVYISFGEEGSVDIVDALRWIRDDQRPPEVGPPRRRGGAPFKVQAFRRFTWELNHRLKGVTLVPPMPDGADEILDDGARLTSDRKPAEGLFAGVLGQFRTALEECAQNEGLVLVLDQIERIQGASLEWLIEHLLQPVALGKVKNVRMIVVARKQDFEMKPMTMLQSSTTPATIISVGYFEHPEIARVARQLCFQWAADRYDYVQSILPRVLKVTEQQGRWNGWALQRVDNACELLG